MPSPSPWPVLFLTRKGITPPLDFVGWVMLDGSP